MRVDDGRIRWWMKTQDGYRKLRCPVIRFGSPRRMVGITARHEVENNRTVRWQKTFILWSWRIPFGPWHYPDWVAIHAREEWDQSGD